MSRKRSEVYAPNDCDMLVRYPAFFLLSLMACTRAAFVANSLRTVPDVVAEGVVIEFNHFGPECCNLV